MAEDYTLTAAPRDSSVKPRALRRAQQVPGVVYGRAFSATSVVFEARALSRMIQRAGRSTLIRLHLAGDPTPQDVLVRDIQRDPVTNQILHVDLYAVVADQMVRNVVPLVQHGEAPVLEQGGVVLQLLDSLEIECLPRNMPQSIVIDVSGLDSFDSRINVADLQIPEGVEVLTDVDTEVITITIPVEEVEEEVEEIEEVEEGAEAEAGEADAEPEQ